MEFATNRPQTFLNPFNIHRATYWKLSLQVGLQIYIAAYSTHKYLQNAGWHFQTNQCFQPLYLTCFNPLGAMGESLLFIKLAKTVKYNPSFENTT